MMTCKEGGFSLPEIMIGGAILAGVALAGATIFRNQSKSQTRSKHDQALSQFHMQLSRTIQNSLNCNATLQGLYNAASVGVSDSNTITGFKICSSNCTLGTDASAVVTSDYISEGEWIDKGPSSQQIWSLKSIDFITTATATGNVTARVTYELSPKIDKRQSVKDIILSVRFSGGQFKQCFSPLESSFNTLQSDVCRALISTSGNLATWNEDSQTCVLNGSPSAPLRDCSAHGSSVLGIASDGTISCKPITEGFTAAGKTQTVPSACDSGEKPNLVWNGTQMQALCSSTPCTPAVACPAKAATYCPNEPVQYDSCGVSCGPGTKSPIQTCAAIAANICSDISAGSDSCGTSCGMGTKTAGCTSGLKCEYLAGDPSGCPPTSDMASEGGTVFVNSCTTLSDCPPILTYPNMCPTQSFTLMSCGGLPP